MCDDANFRGGRLRLTAFLRVVENGIPERPSRFKRRVPSAAPLSETTKQHMNYIETSSIDTPAHTRCQPSSSGLPQMSRDVRVVLSSDVARGAPGTDVSPGGLLNPLTSKVSVHDPLRTSTPAASSRESGENKTEEDFNRSETSVVANVIESARAPQKSKKDSNKTNSHGSSSTRKRRLPVQSLPLVRTITIDGLPDPSDAEDIFAVSINVVDPIDDSQMSTLFAVRSCDQGLGSPRRLTQLKSSPSSSDQGNRHPRSRSCRPRVKQSSSKRRTSLYKKALTNNLLQTQFVADGFEGDELNITTEKKRRRRAISTRPDPLPGSFPVGASLALATGMLPSPVNPHEAESFLSHETATPLTSEIIDKEPPPNQPVPGRPYVPDNRTSFSRCQREDQDTAICSQLLSITAPARCDSESSESDSSIDACSLDDEEIANADATEDSSLDCAFDQQPPRPTYTGDLRYFENAMYHLDNAESIRSHEHDFWSQYNLLE
ncbi:hypothetical protein FB567DRAFT_323024 [Paraphoma chrysanthemicola]|uniref:Uncharacterized protein n=1 Tax=Paraphoma chrysanthemicola TaxID=798071 RepID=A0A8K0R8V6_9PLEO|nr:hypothetical protein FB567DRAFT_323024 [Paraphoma chrysanthemicola]